MTTTLYDSTEPLAIPGGAPAVAGYIDGSYADWAILTTDFAGRPVVSITTTGMLGARVADVENGDLTPNSGAAWARSEIAANRRPTLYCNRSTWPDVIAALHALGVALSAVDFWVADWTGYAHQLAGAVATQYASPSTDSGGDYDLSVANNVWLAPSIVQPPPPPPMLSYKMGDGTMMHVVTIPTSPAGVANAGDGWIQTSIPFADFLSATIRKSAPARDGGYWPGDCGVNDTDGEVLVSVTGCEPGVPVVVYVNATS